jgi:hypothetical protein
MICFPIYYVNFKAKNYFNSQRGGYTSEVWVGEIQPTGIAKCLVIL